MVWKMNVLIFWWNVLQNQKKDYVYGQFPLKENFPWKSKWSNFIGWNWITTENFPLEETDL